MLLANENTYRKLSTFESVEEMNEAIRAHKQAHKLTDTERAVLDVISRYSCKYPGVSFLSKNKIAEAVGKVRRTVIRVCNRLEALGIIKQYETKRDGGDRRQSTNVIVILPFRNSEVDATCHHPEYVQLLHEVGTPVSRDSKRSPVNANEVTPDMSRHKTPITKQNNNTYKESDKLPASYLRRYIPAGLFEAMAKHIPTASELYNVYGTLLRAKASVDKGVTIEDNLRAYIDAFRAVIWRAKRGKVRNITGYLYAAWRQCTVEIKRREYFGQAADWLGEA